MFSRRECRIEETLRVQSSLEVQRRRREVQQVRGGNPTPHPALSCPLTPLTQHCVSLSLLFMCCQSAGAAPCGPVNLTSDPITRREVLVLSCHVVWRTVT